LKNFSILSPPVIFVFRVILYNNTLKKERHFLIKRVIIHQTVTVQGLLKNVDQPESCTQVLAHISGFHRSTRALTQAEPHLAVAPEL